MSMKKRKQREILYNEKYKHIPIDYMERLEWMFDKYKLSQKQCNNIIFKRNNIINNLYYNDLFILLLEEPKGTVRSRFRIVNRSNFHNMAIQNSQFVHVYTPNAKADHLHMKRLTEDELEELDQLICTPCEIEYITYHKTPTAFSITDTFLAEIGLLRPITKPDWDNLGKKYSDMSNHNIWLDDSFVTDGTVRKYYSILPRVEIYIKYLNMVYSKYQYNSICNRKDFKEYGCKLQYFKHEE